MALSVVSISPLGKPATQSTSCRRAQPVVLAPRRALRTRGASLLHPANGRRSKLLQAAGGSSSGGGGSGGQTPAKQLVASPFYRIWLQLGVVLLLAMLVDAGYSRDWSRIGVLTREQEEVLQQVAAAVGGFHLLCGAAAAAVSSRRGENWGPRVAKVLAVGLLALVEVVLLPEGEGDAAEGKR